MPEEGVRLQVVAARPEGVRWRLVAGNGRPLATAVDTFTDRAGALADFATVKAALLELVPQYLHPRSSVDWVWSAVAPGGVQVKGARIYTRLGTCMAAFARFTASAATVKAEPAE